MESATVDLTDGRVALSGALDAATTSVLRIICALGTANGALMLVVTAAGHRTAFALVAATAWVAVWWLLRQRAHELAGRLSRQPGLLVVVAVVGIAPIALDGGLEGTLSTQAIWLTWVAAVTISAGMTLALAGVMALATTAALIGAGMSVDELLSGPDRFQATLLIFNPIVVALVGLALVGVFRRILGGAADALVDIREGGAASTPGLTQLLHRQAPRLLQAPAPEALTEAEQAIVAMLRDGLMPKQIAHRRQTALSTVRTQIKHIKRKTGARTLNDLIGRTWRSS